jgi:predicted nucleotidyltransferase
MNDRIVEELARIERQYDVRVLLAVESGSRAWGFASPDSDYDVRFVYAHRPDWYLSVFEQRDVIEEMLPGDLDVSGWDLRKTLRLFSKCNLALNEWLGSPLIYCEVAEFRAQLSTLIPQFFNPIAAIHHYRSMAEGSFNENFIEGQIGIKKLFYVLRPLLACRWIEKSRAQPPTKFSQLVDAEWVGSEERRWIGELLRTKAGAAERQQIALDSQRAAAIREELVHYDSASKLVPGPSKAGTDLLDRVMREWLPESEK